MSEQKVSENPRSKSFSTWWQRNGAACRAQGGFVDTTVARQIWNAAYDQQAASITTLEQERDTAAQEMFEACVKAICVVCKSGAPLDVRGEHHTRPVVQCAAANLHKKFPKRSEAMNTKARGA